MASDSCPHESETIRAAWSEGDAHPTLNLHIEPDLAAHIAACSSCAEIAALAQAFREERDAACAAAHPPAAGLVWWRAERRAREEAARRATRPISFVHGIALGCAAAALVAIVGLGLGDAEAHLVRWWNAVPSTMPAAGPVGLLTSLPLGSLLVAAASLLLAPVVIYLALEK